MKNRELSKFVFEGKRKEILVTQLTLLRKQQTVKYF
jgi:hypothetical protein